MAQDIKLSAKDEIMRVIADLVLNHQEGTYGEPDGELIQEIRKQAMSIGKRWGYVIVPGLFDQQGIIKPFWK